VNYYRLAGAAITDDIRFGSAKLLRGRNAWTRNTNQNRLIKKVRDSYIDFSTGDTQSIWAVLTENAQVSSKALPNGFGLVTWLQVNHDIDYTPSVGMQLVPPDNIDTATDQKPKYAIYKVNRIRSVMAIEDEDVVLKATSQTELSQKSVIIEGASQPVVTNSGGTITYTRGTDYELRTDIQGTGYIYRLEDSFIGDGDTVEVSYSLDPDITRFVSAIVGDSVVMKVNFEARQDERFEVTYRFIPKGNNEIIKSTIKATERYGDAAPGVLYKEGPDYSIDISNGRMSIMTLGEVANKGRAAYVDFSYYDTPEDVETFTAWVRVEQSEPVIFDFNPFNMDTEAGEKVFIRSGVQTVDLTRASQSPELSRGWHQVIVRSKDPDTNANSAIKQVTELLDVNSVPVFLSGGRYFDQVRATRQVMKQVTFVVVLNFQPGATTDLYLDGLRINPATGLYTSGTRDEEFELEYSYELANAEVVEQILVRMLLNRKAHADGGMTPKVWEYHLRLG
jgi:hypothetical protein